MKHAILLTHVYLILASTILHGNPTDSLKQPFKKALIFGVTGQDGSYLAELLLDKGYIVHGVKRKSSLLNTSRIDHLYNDLHSTSCEQRFILHYGDITDASNVIRLIAEIKPDEIYNLAAQSHVKVSFELPEYTADCDALGTLHILEAIRLLDLKSSTKFIKLPLVKCLVK